MATGADPHKMAHPAKVSSYFSTLTHLFAANPQRDGSKSAPPSSASICSLYDMPSRIPSDELANSNFESWGMASRQTTERRYKSRAPPPGMETKTDRAKPRRAPKTETTTAKSQALKRSK